MLTIDEIAYNSPLAEITPKIKLVFGVLCLILCLVLNSYAVSVLLIFVMAWAAVRITKVSLKTYLALLGIPLGFLLLGTLTIIIGRYPLGADLLCSVDILNHSYGISKEGLAKGVLLILKALGAVSCLYFISLNTPMTYILAALRSWHIPSLFLALMELIYRYIFLVLAEAHSLKTAQASRLGYTSFRTGLKSFGELLGTLFLRTYLKGDRIYAALESRGYDGSFKSLDLEFKQSKTLVWTTVGLSIVLIGLAIGERSFL